MQKKKKIEFSIELPGWFPWGAEVEAKSEGKKAGLKKQKLGILSDEKVQVFLVFLLAAIVMTWDLELYGAYHDEASFAYMSYQIYKGEKTLVWANTGIDPVIALPLYLESISFHLFGVSDFSHRLPSALMGALSVIACYIIAREFFSRKIALASSLFFSLSAWHLQLHRTLPAFGGPAHFFAIFALASLVYGMKKKPVFIWVSGIFSALALMSHGPSAVMFPVMGAAVVVCGKECIMKNWKHLLAAFCLFIITIYIPTQEGLKTTFGHVNNSTPVWLVNAKSGGYLNQTLTQYEKDVQGTTYATLTNQKDMYLVLFPYSILGLSILGILISLYKHEKGHVFLLLWFVIATFSFLFLKHVDGSLQPRYMIAIMPLPYILSAVSIIAISDFAGKFIPKAKNIKKIDSEKIAILLILIVMATQMIFLYDNYFYGWLEKYGGNGLFTGKVPRGQDRLGFFKGQREAAQFISERIIWNGAVVVDDRNEDLFQQMLWYSEGKVLLDRVIVDYMYPFNPYVNLTYRDVLAGYVAQRQDINEIYYVYNIRENDCTQHKYFKNVHPDWEPIHVIRDYNGTPAIAIYYRKIEPILKKISLGDCIDLKKDLNQWAISGDAGIKNASFEEGAIKFTLGGNVSAAQINPYTYFDYVLQNNTEYNDSKMWIRIVLKGTANMKYALQTSNGEGIWCGIVTVRTSLPLEYFPLELDMCSAFTLAKPGLIRIATENVKKDELAFMYVKEMELCREE